MPTTTNTSTRRKIINDPVYGFITIQHPLIFSIIEHPYYQRLRRIQQMALAHLVYPGAVHTRLHHSLGAYHLMCNALTELKSKGVTITPEEEVATQAAILMHDIGHGPFSHALEHRLVPNVHHETLSLLIMEAMNRDLNGALDMAIEIFTARYSKPFLHQLISGQIDVDRMDYLSRDSFFTGVSEGVIGYDRILKMLTVHNDALMVEEKGIHSVEKFLIARRQMYWQVYLHKTVLAAEKMLVKIIDRVREIYSANKDVLLTQTALDYFFDQYQGVMNTEALTQFCSLDDADVMHAVKVWSRSNDVVLKTLCTHVLDRKLLKCKLQATPFDMNEVQAKRAQLAKAWHISEAEASYLVFTGEATNTTYQPQDESIRIITKDKTVVDIAEVDNSLIHQTLQMPVKKFYICQPACF